MSEKTQECPVCCQLKTKKMVDETQKDVSFEQLNADVENVENILVKLQVLTDRQNPNNASHIYINQIQQTLDTIQNHIQCKAHSTKMCSHSIDTNETVKKKLREDAVHSKLAWNENENDETESIDSSSSQFNNLTSNLSTALLMRLMSKLPKENKSCYLSDTKYISKRLSSLFLAKVVAGERDFMAVQDNINDITTSMMKSLLATFVTPENLMRVAMEKSDPIFDQAVLNVLHCEIKARQKTGRVANCFLAIGKALKKVFCC